MANRLMSTARHQALKAKRINFNLDEPELPKVPGWPAIIALGTNYPELAYKQFRDSKRGFVYDNRKSADGFAAPIARIDQIRDGVYAVIVTNTELCRRTTVGQCLQYIKVNLLRIV